MAFTFPHKDLVVLLQAIRTVVRATAGAAEAALSAAAGKQHHHLPVSKLHASVKINTHRFKASLRRIE